jgi:hypothetical protein
MHSGIAIRRLGQLSLNRDKFCPIIKELMIFSVQPGMNNLMRSATSLFLS